MTSTRQHRLMDISSHFLPFSLLLLQNLLHFLGVEWASSLLVPILASVHIRKAGLSTVDIHTVEEVQQGRAHDADILALMVDSLGQLVMAQGFE